MESTRSMRAGLHATPLGAVPICRAARVLGTKENSLPKDAAGGPGTGAGGLPCGCTQIACPGTWLTGCFWLSIAIGMTVRALSCNTPKRMVPK